MTKKLTVIQFIVNRNEQGTVTQHRNTETRKHIYIYTRGTDRAGMFGMLEDTGPSREYQARHIEASPGTMRARGAQKRSVTLRQFQRRETKNCRTAPTHTGTKRWTVTRRPLQSRETKNCCTALTHTGTKQALTHAKKREQPTHLHQRQVGRTDRRSGSGLKTGAPRPRSHRKECAGDQHGVPS